MKPLVANALVFALTTGCASQRAAQVGIGGGALVGVAGVLTASLGLLSAGCDTECSDGTPLFIAGGGMIVGGLALLVISAVQFSNLETPHEQADLRTPRELTDEALAAARAGDCVRVRALRVQLQAVSTPHYFDVFGRYPEIRACLPLE